MPAPTPLDPRAEACELNQALPHMSDLSVDRVLKAAHELLAETGEFDELEAGLAAPPPQHSPEQVALG